MEHKKHTPKHENHQAPAAPAPEPVQVDAENISIPIADFEALTVSFATSNRGAQNEIMAKLTAMAEDQAPGKYPSAKHPR